jgi:hypothetical protein
MWEREMKNQTIEARNLADILAALEGSINTYHNRFIIEDVHTGRKYRLSRSLMLGGNTNDPAVVLQIREER